MSEDKDYEILMLMHKIINNNLISSKKALIIAKRVFREQFGNEELKKRLPLKIYDSGDRWKIIAPFSPKPEDIDPDPDVATPREFEMYIRKSNGEIIGFQWKYDFHLVELSPEAKRISEAFNLSRKK